MIINFSIFKVLYLSSFFIFILFDYLVRINVFGGKFKYYYFKFTTSNFIFFTLTSFIIVYTIFYVTGAFDHISTFITEPNSSLIFMANGDDSLNITNSVENKGINVSNDVKNSGTDNMDNNSVFIQNPTFSVDLSDKAMTKLAAAGSAVGGLGAAVKVMQHIPGSPTVKAIAGASAMAAVQLTTYGMSKALSGGKDSNILDTKLVDDVTNNTDATTLYPDYPLNLLYEIEGLINVEVIVVILLINIFIVQYLISKDYSKYIPDNKFGKYLNIFLNRYVKIYSKSNKFIIGLCVCNLIMCIFATRFFIYCIMNH